jgi:hypothetical protein
MAYQLITPHDLWRQTRFLSYFYCIRGLDVPMKTLLKQNIRSLTLVDWLWLTWFSLTNLLRLGSSIATFVYFLKADKSAMVHSHGFMTTYETFASPITILLLAANMATVVKTRAVLITWAERTEELCSAKPEALMVRSGHQQYRSWSIFVTKVGVTATYIFGAYYAHHLAGLGYYGSPLAFYIKELTYLDLTYNLNTAAVTLVYIAESFFALAREVKVVRASRVLSSREKGERLSNLFEDWVVLKRVAEDVGQAAAPYLALFLFWTTCTSSLKVLIFTDLDGFKMNTPARIWFQVLSFSVRTFLMLLLYEIGELVSSAVRSPSPIYYVINLHDGD